VCPSPELELRVSPEFDRQLRQWWEQQTLRPGTSTHPLPLDDAAADPQREVALRGVLAAMKKGRIAHKEAERTPKEKSLAPRP